MEKTPLPFWEEAYRQEEVAAFSAAPNDTVREFLPLLNQNAPVLEVGCGEGQNALYLARQGFGAVDAFDLSEHGIEKLKKRAEQSGLKLNAFVQDLTTFHFQRQYGCVLSFATLCFVPKDAWKEFICEAKRNTLCGGVHIMQLFTDTEPASADIAPFAVGLAHDGELKELYGDWEVLQFASYAFDDEHPNVPRHRHSANKIVARKPG